MAYTQDITERDAGFLSATLLSNLDGDNIAQFRITSGDGKGVGWDDLTLTSSAKVLAAITPVMIPQNAAAITAGLHYTGIVALGGGAFALQFRKAVTVGTAGALWTINIFRPNADMKRR